MGERGQLGTPRHHPEPPKTEGSRALWARKPEPRYYRHKVPKLRRPPTYLNSLLSISKGITLQVQPTTLRAPLGFGLPGIGLPVFSTTPMENLTLKTSLPKAQEHIGWGGGRLGTHFEFPRNGPVRSDHALRQEDHPYATYSPESCRPRKTGRRIPATSRPGKMSKRLSALTARF